jgi:hypothetical protein
LRRSLSTKGSRSFASRSARATISLAIWGSIATIRSRRSLRSLVASGASTSAAPTGGSS